MNILLNLLGLLLTAALVENPFYTRCFIAETVDAQLNERRDVMLRSLIAAAMCLPAAMAGWAGRMIFIGYTDIPVYLSPGGHPFVYRGVFADGGGAVPCGGRKTALGGIYARLHQRLLFLFAGGRPAAVRAQFLPVV